MVLDYLEVRILGTKMVSVGCEGVHVLYAGDGILSDDKKHRCFLSGHGELIVESKSNALLPWFGVGGHKRRNLEQSLW
jgi:hypothetical protein